MTRRLRPQPADAFGVLLGLLALGLVLAPRLVMLVCGLVVVVWAVLGVVTIVGGLVAVRHANRQPRGHYRPSFLEDHR